MANLQNLYVVAGDTETVTVTTDTPAQAAVASIVDGNLNLVTALTSVLDGDGDELTIDLPASTTMAARNKGTILQIAWDYGSSQIKNTRVYLVGVK